MKQGLTLDTVMAGVIAALFAVIGLIVARGDQVGLSVIRRTGDTGAPRAIVEIVFDEAIELAALQPYFKIDPPVRGELSVTNNIVQFVPSIPFTTGSQYTFTLNPGIRGASARELKQPVTWTYTIRSPRVAYLAPVNAPVQNIFIADAVNSTPIQITDSERGVLSYDVAADGMRIVYTELLELGQARLMMWDASTGSSSILYTCEDAACQDPVFRPDGSGIAFQKQELNSETTMTPGVPRPYLLDFNTRQVAPLFEDSQTIGYDVRWSPDGDRLAIYSGSAGGILIREVDAADSAADQFIPSQNGENGKFSPDGQSILYPVVLQPAQGLAVQHFIRADLNTSPPTQSNILPDTDTANDVEAEWYIDGLSLIVGRRPPYRSGQPAAGPQIYQLDLQTREAKPLVVDLDYSHNTLLVSPDGSELVYSRFTLNIAGARPEIWAYSFKTGQIRQIAHNASRPKWIP